MDRTAFIFMIFGLINIAIALMFRERGKNPIPNLCAAVVLFVIATIVLVAA